MFLHYHELYFSLTKINHSFINIYYPQYTVFHILSHCTSYSFYFIICSLFHSHLYLYIYSLVLCFIVLLLMLFLFHFLFYYYYNFFFFCTSIERTCPDLHFTTDYTLCDCVCDKYKEPWTLNLITVNVFFCWSDWLQSVLIYNHSFTTHFMVRLWLVYQNHG